VRKIRCERAGGPAHEGLFYPNRADVTRGGRLRQWRTIPFRAGDAENRTANVGGLPDRAW